MAFDQYSHMLPYAAKVIIPRLGDPKEIYQFLDPIMGFDVASVPVFLQDGTLVPKSRAIVGGGECFGVVSEGYQTIQNSDVLGLTADIMARGGRPLAGGRAGSRFYLVFFFGELEFQRENYISLLTVSWGHGGSHAVNFAPSFLRLFCRNQMPSMTSGRVGQSILKVTHYQNALQKFEVASDLSLMLAEEAKEQGEFLAHLASKPFKQDELLELAKLAGSSEKQSEKISEFWDTDLALPSPDLRGTAYHALQAFTAFGSHTGSDRSRLDGARISLVRRAAALLAAKNTDLAFPTFEPLLS